MFPRKNKFSVRQKARRSRKKTDERVSQVKTNGSRTRSEHSLRTRSELVARNVTCVPNSFAVSFGTLFFSCSERIVYTVPSRFSGEDERLADAF